MSKQGEDKGGSSGGGQVRAKNEGKIFTDGDQSHGILAVSRSGQGGAGGSTYGLVEVVVAHNQGMVVL